MLPRRDKSQCECVTHDGSERWHGRSSGYYSHGCLCAACVEFMRDYSRQRYVTNRTAHQETMRGYRQAHRDSILEGKWEYRQANRDAIRVREDVYMRAIGELDALAERKHRRWTPAEDEMILRTDLRVVDIAAELGRTFRAVKARRALLRKGGEA